jgi:calcium-dependent protein kinase
MGGEASRPQDTAAAKRPGRSDWPTGFLGNNTDLNKNYELSAAVLGEGNFGTVRKVVLRRDMELQDGTEARAGRCFALKSIAKQAGGACKAAEDEVDMLLRLRHEHIARLHEVYHDSRHMHLVLELCAGGELFDQICSRAEAGEVHTERETRRAFRQMLQAVAHMHSQGVVHRDLKPENLLLSSSDDDAPIKVVDFGLSCLHSVDEVQKQLVGSPIYMAPEVIARRYSEKCDVWSLGVILHLMLTGAFPFADMESSHREIYAAIEAGHLSFPDELFCAVSAEARDVVRQCLTREEQARPSAGKLLEHAWLAQPDAAAGGMAGVGGSGARAVAPAAPSFGGLRSSSVRPLQAAIRRLRHYQQVNHLQQRAHAIVAEQLTHAEIKALENQFHALDVNKDGKLSAEELARALNDSGRQGQMVVRELVSGGGGGGGGGEVDGHEAIDFNQFIKATLETNTHLQQQRLQLAFDEFDKDGDGQLSIEELTLVMGSEQHALEVMADLDADGDGKISKEEFSKMWKPDGSRQQELAEEAGGGAAAAAGGRAGGPAGLRRQHSVALVEQAIACGGANKRAKRET